MLKSVCSQRRKIPNANNDDPPPHLWLVIPCYNEEKVLPETAGIFLDKIIALIERKVISNESRICFVNDGSSDTTWKIIQSLSMENEHALGISLSRNFGHQNALLAGLSEAVKHCDISISIDCDGQDDIDAISDMIAQYSQGYDIVYGVRSERSTDTILKRLSAESFYKLLSSMGAEVVFNHADYRLISSRALKHLLDFQEVNVYLRGLVPMVGFPSTTVPYKRHERLAGESHYPFSKMMKLALDGITSLSIKPIRFISAIGFIFGLLGFAGIVWSFISFLLGGTIAGWSSLMCVICLLGSIQIMSLGILGEYIGKIYLESKHRPRYIIGETTYPSALPRKESRHE